MNIEEKAKAYDKAIEVARPLYERAKKDDCPIWSTYETIFPEFAESEDERIIRKITAILANTPTEIFVREGIKFCECNDWLEKQKCKESSHVSESRKENDDSFTNEDERIRKRLIDLVSYNESQLTETESEQIYNWLEKQKEEGMYKTE